MQSVPSALAIFNPTSSAAIETCFPECNAAAQFLRLINLWWKISNSKHQFNMNFHRGDAAKANNCKPTFLRKLADWFSEWKTPATSQHGKVYPHQADHFGIGNDFEKHRYHDRRFASRRLCLCSHGTISN